MSKIWVNSEILNYMRGAPQSTVEEVQAAFPHYSDTTIKTQRNRCIRVLTGKPSRSYKKNKQPKVRDEARFQDSLIALSNIPRSDFVAPEAAAVAMNGNKLHVNLVSAEQAQIDRAAAYADEWVAWLKCVENVPKGDQAVDFSAWINHNPKNIAHRTAKLLKRMQALQDIVSKLDSALK